MSGFVNDMQDGTLDPGDIAALVVNGVNTPVDEKTGRWWRMVPVATGENALSFTAEVTDRDGNVSSSAVTVPSRFELPAYTYLSLLPDGESAVVSGSWSLRKVDLTTGEEQQITGEPVGAPGQSVRKGVQVDAQGQQVYVLRGCSISNCGSDAVEAVRVQFDDGSVSELGRLSAWGTVGSFSEYLYFDVRDDWFAYSGRSYVYIGNETPRCGLDLLNVETGSQARLLNNPVRDEHFKSNFCPGAVSVDARRNRVIAAYDTSQGSSAFPGLYAIDLVTGALSVASGNGVGLGPELQPPQYLFATSGGESVITLGEQGIFAVDLESGDRTLLLADPEIPADMTDAEFDETHNRIVIASGGRIISSLDLASGGVETLLSFSNAVGSGPDLVAYAPVVLDKVHNRLLVVDGDMDAVVEIDLATLQRHVLAENLHSVSAWTRVVLNDEGTVLYYQAFNDDLYAVDLVSGEQRLLTGRTVGSGPDLDRLSGMCLDGAKDLLYVVGRYTLYNLPNAPFASFAGVLSVDTVTGERRIVSGEEMALDGYDRELDAILCDAAGERLLVASGHAKVLEVNPSSGQRHRLVGPSDDNGGGADPRGFAWDTNSGRVLLHVHYQNEEEIRSINLDTGEYEIAARIPHMWIYDRAADVFYSSRDIADGRGEYFMQDRKTGSQEVIAHPP